MMLMYNLIEHSNHYSKTSESWLQWVEPDNTVTNSKSFKFKERKTGKTPTTGNTKVTFSPKSRNKRLQNYGQWIKHIWSNSKKWSKNTW